MDQSLRLIVKGSPLDPPLLDTNSASTIEIRDDGGNLAGFVVFIPGHPVFMLAKPQDSNFESLANGFGIPLKQPQT